MIATKQLILRLSRFVDIEHNGGHEEEYQSPRTRYYESERHFEVIETPTAV